MYQKKIALVNDITGFGRCSTAVQLPIISAFKIQACLLPTAILSVHTQFPDYYIDDYTDRMTPYIDSWKKNRLQFDGICTGFLGSEAQIAIVEAFIRDFKQKHTKVIVDPVMGDYGRLYASYTESLCAGVRRLLPDADVITPNLTEACQLLAVPYPKDGEAAGTVLEKMAQELCAKGPSQVVITGIHDGDCLDNFIYERGKQSEILKVKKIGSDRSGTGDVFTAIVAAMIVRGDGLKESVRTAADFISRTMIYTEALDIPHYYGLAFEEYLNTLGK